MTRTEQKMRKALNNACVLEGNIRDLRDRLGSDDQDVRDELELAIYDVMQANHKLMAVMKTCGLTAALL